MNFYEVARRVSGHDEWTDAECMKFMIHQWGLIVSWLRENEGSITGYFPITRVARADLEDIGFDVSQVKDHTMTQLASKMADAYCESVFWIDLPILAENLSIPKKICRHCGRVHKNDTAICV